VRRRKVREICTVQGHRSREATIGRHCEKAPFAHKGATLGEVNVNNVVFRESADHRSRHTGRPCGD
jgi:hypothetical protein